MGLEGYTGNREALRSDGRVDRWWRWWWRWGYLRGGGGGGGGGGAGGAGGQVERGADPGSLEEK